MSGDQVVPELGNCMLLANIPLGTDVHNIELKPGKGGMLARSAGSYGTLTSRDGKYAIIKLPFRGIKDGPDLLQGYHRYRIQW